MNSWIFCFIAPQNDSDLEKNLFTLNHYDPAPKGDGNKDGEIDGSVFFLHQIFTLAQIPNQRKESVLFTLGEVAAAAVAEGKW